MALPKPSLQDQIWKEDCSSELTEEDEAPSLSDLPLSFIHEDSQQGNKEQENQEADETVFEFEFGSLSSSSSSSDNKACFRRDSDICVADKVFFQGRIVPLRHPIVSRPEPAGTRPETRVDRRDSSNSAVSRRKRSLVDHRNPSPNGKSIGRVGGNRKSSVWELFRVGLVRAPGIEMQKLDVHNTRRRNREVSTSSMKEKKKQTLFSERRRRSRGFLRGCSCAAETVPLDVIVVRSENGRNSMEDKMKEMKI